jgi:hypothetical protein
MKGAVLVWVTDYGIMRIDSKDAEDAGLRYSYKGRPWRDLRYRLIDDLLNLWARDEWIAGREIT